MIYHCLLVLPTLCSVPAILKEKVKINRKRTVRTSAVFGITSTCLRWGFSSKKNVGSFGSHFWSQVPVGGAELALCFPMLLNSAPICVRWRLVGWGGGWSHSLVHTVLWSPRRGVGSFFFFIRCFDVGWMLLPTQQHKLLYFCHVTC